MNTTIPLETPTRRFPTDVTSSFPDQYRVSSDSPSRDGSQKSDPPQAERPNQDAVKPDHSG